MSDQRHYAEEEPGDGIRTEKWVGAFERVLGDHQGEALSIEKKSNRANGNGRSIRGQEDELDCGERDRDGGVMQRSRSSAPTTSSSTSSENASPRVITSTLPSGIIENFNRHENLGLHRTNTDPGVLDQRRGVVHQPSTFNQSGSGSGSGRNQGSSNLLSVMDNINSTPSARRSFGDEPFISQKSDSMGLGLGGVNLPSSSTSTAALKSTSNSRSLVSISVPVSESTAETNFSTKGINFDEIYLNHAPGLRLVKVRNSLENKRVLVRLESDLGRGVSFMRRKRTAPRHTLDSVTWPANSSAWAEAGGLTPARLRDLRHMGANLEPSDSFILEPGAGTDLFVVFKPSLYASQSTRDNSKFTQIISPQIPQEAEVRDQDSNKASASVSGSESAVSPSSGFESIPHFSSRSNASSSSTDLSTSSRAYSQGQDSISSSQAAPVSTQPEIVTSSEPADSAHAAFEVRGSVTLRAWALTSAGSEPTPRSQSQPRSDDGNESGASNLSSGPSSRPPSFYSSNVSSATSNSVSLTEQEDGELETEDGEEMQTTKLQLFARSCRAQLALSMDLVESEESSNASRKSNGTSREKESDSNQKKPFNQTQAQRHGLLTCDLGDILVGQQEERTFAIHNLAEIPCFWQVKFEDAENMLQSSPVSVVGSLSSKAISAINTGVGEIEGEQDFDYNKEHTLCTRILPPRTSNHLKILLQPKEPCRDYEQVITFTNLHETSNSIRILVRANILGSAKDDVLSVLSGDDLDFGDCCGGHWTRQLLVLKNPGDTLLDVAFSIQKGVEATFQLAELAPQNEAEESQEMAPPFIPHSSGSAASSTEMLIGATGYESGSVGTGAPLSSEDGYSASRSIGCPSSPGGSATSQLELHSTAALELTRTPTHHPQVNSGVEPPHFQLPGARSPHSGDARGAPIAIKPHCESSLAPRMRRNEDEDVDASSNASQAGSRAGSPPPFVQAAQPSPTSASSWGAAGETPKDALGPVRSELKWGSGPGSDGSTQASSLGGRGISEAVSDHASGAGSFIRNKASSSLLSSKGPVSALRGFEGSEHFDDAASSRSDITAISQDSRLGPIVAGSSSQGNSSNAARSQHSTRIGAGISGLRNVEQGHNNQLEELVLRPGGEYRVIVSYRPPRGSLDEEYNAGKLVETKFRISLDYARSRSGGTRSRGGRARKTILCHTRTCTSFISVSPKLVDFGEANVGARKSANIAVKNHSELTARVDLRFVSKVLSMYRDEVAIPPLQTVELKVDFFPRRVNEAYRKQITVANLLNRHNDQIFEVRSQNVDQQRVSFHSLFYRILTPTGSNFIDFGDVNIGSTRIRSFGIENTSSAKLSLDLSAAHPEDLTLYVKAPPPKTSSVGQVNDSNASLTSTTRTPNRYAEVEASDVFSATSSNDTEAQAGGLRPRSIKGGTSKGADLKERFLETISVDSPASIRHENAIWRVAQRQSHFAKKKAGGEGGGTSKGNGATSKSKAPLNLFSALKKGGKGRITVNYGKSVTFKDRKLIQDFEFLDLATGPPVDQKRISAKSKKYQALEALETGKKVPKAGAAKSAKSALSPPPSEAGDAPKSVVRKKATSKTPATHTDFETPRKNGLGIGGTNQPLPTLKTAAGVSEAGTAAGDDGSGNRSPAITGKRKASLVLSDPTDVSKLSLEELLAAVEAQTSNLNTFFLGNPAAEERHVRTEINLLKELRAAISSSRLVRADSLVIEPGVEHQVIALYSPNGSTRPHVQGNARKQDSRIFLRLTDFDTSLVKTSPEFAPMATMDRDELPVRDLMVRSTTCRSLLELGQPHINFGHMDKGDTKTRKILIQNRSEWALRYCIRKSGSISSGDIKLSSGRYGVVPGYGKREVEFIFSPSLSGQFQERLVVENVGDRDNDQTVVLKANVRKVPNFTVDPVSIDFGACKPGKLSSAESFVVTNTTAKTRTFVVAVDPHDLRLQRAIVDLVLTTANSGEIRGTLSKAEEEEVEHISQKLKIASRKGHSDKVKKYEGRLEELGVRQASPDSEQQPTIEAEDGGDVGGESVSAQANESEATEENPSARLKRVSSLVTVGLAPNQSKRLLLRIRANAVDTVLGAAHSAAENHVRATTEEVSIPMRVHEVKNQDETRTVTVKALVELEEESVEAGEELPNDAVIFTSLSAAS